MSDTVPPPPPSPAEVEYAAARALRASTSSALHRAVDGIEDAASAARRLAQRIARDAARLTPLPPPPALDGPITQGMMFVDDDDFARDSVQMMFERFAPGVPLHLAANAADALELWREKRPSMVVVDLWLGRGPDGDAVLAEMPRGVTRVLVSGTIHGEHLAQCARRAMATSLPKDEDLVFRLIDMARAQQSAAAPKKT